MPRRNAGQTIAKQGERQEQVPRQPHERDESADSQERGDSFDRAIADAGRRDVERGAVDTDKGPVLDETYQRVRESAPNPERKFRP